MVVCLCLCVFVCVCVCVCVSVIVVYEVEYLKYFVKKLNLLKWNEWMNDNPTGHTCISHLEVHVNKYELSC